MSHLINRPEYLTQLIQNKDIDLVKIVTGIRRCGKSSLLDLFHQYLSTNNVPDTHIIHMNLESLRYRNLTNYLSFYDYVSALIPATGKTYLIFDELQVVEHWEKAVESFRLDFDVDIYITGSNAYLLSTEFSTLLSGRYVEIRMLPLSFKEFLMANGENMLVDYIDKGNRNLGAFEARLTDYLKKYMIIGGMPAVVTEWLGSKDYNKVNRIQQELIAAYQKDFSKHAPKYMVEKIRYVWNSIPSQLAKENKKFVYGLVREGARAREYEDAIMWLSDAGEIIRTNNVSKPDIPISAYADLKSFKVFLLDVGLLRAMSKISPKVILEGSRIFEEFKGALTEQYVCQELQNFTETLETNYYWSSSATAEVDFLISDGLDVYPLEAKAGVTMNAKSLKLYREKYSPKWSVRTSLLPYERNNSYKTINIPLYMLFVLDKELKAES